MNLTKLILAICGCGLCLVLARPAFAQVATSTTLVGRVTDSSGAVILGAKIVAVQDETKVAYPGQTNDTGDYTIPYVPVGTYTITVSAPGFGNEVHNNVIVEINQTVRTDVVLKVGTVASEVTVSSAAPPIATDDASLLTTTSSLTIQSLPVSGHDELKLSLTAAGVQQFEDSTVGDPPGESFSGPGVPGEQNDVTLDGVSIMNSIHTITDFRPSPDALQEVSVQTGTYSAQYGNYLGIHINAVSKTGGNALHGALDESVRNNILDAHDFFDLPGTEKNPLHQNQFGGEVDGPVVFPHIYNGKNRTFFMFDYQGVRESSKTTQISTVLTNAERTGNFSALLTGAKPVTLSDPVDPTCITGDVIQARCINPISLEYLNFLPVANQPGLVNNSITAPLSGNNLNQYLGRVDEVINQNSRLYVRYAYQKANSFTGVPFAPDSSYSPTTQKNFVVGYTQVFRHNLVNEFEIGKNSILEESADGYFVNPSLDSQLGVLNIPGYANPAGNPGDPSVSITGYLGMGSGARNSTQTDDIWTATDSLTLVHGAHTIIAGTDIELWDTTRFAANSPRGSFSFNGTMTGNGAADFMRGLLVADTTPTVQLGSAGRQWRYDFFGLDKWNATRNLTLNIGLRYELPTVPVSPSGYANVLNAAGTALVPASATVADAVPNYPLTLPNHHDWAPRFGFAYRVGSRAQWVVRGGIGIYYSPNSMNDETILSLNPPFGTNFTYNTSRANPVMTFSNPNPTAALGTAAVPSIYTIGPHYPPAAMYQWSLDVERALWSGAGLDVQYLGNHTDHLATSWQMNTPLPGPGPIQARRPYQNFGTIRNIDDEGWSNYDGMSVVLTQRLYKGISMQLNYTWSHTLDLGSFSETGGASPVNPYDWRSDYANSSDDRPQRFVGSYVWEMPFFRKASNGLVRSAVGGWSLSGVVTIGPGAPGTVTSGVDVANTGQGGQRPNLVGPINASRCGQVLLACINSTAFATAAAYTYGDAGRNIFFGPGLTNFDTSLGKTFRIHERFNLEVRADAYNTFNHPNFGGPASTLSAATFGNITSDVGPRVMELEGRLTF